MHLAIGMARQVDVVRQAEALRQIARWRAIGVAIPVPLLERLRDEDLAVFLRCLNTRQAATLAETPIQHVVAFLLTGRPLAGVPGLNGRAGRKASQDDLRRRG